MKTKISYKKMLDLAQYKNQQIYKIGYCEWQNLFRLIDKLETGLIYYYQMPYYSAGQYGWNCDYYQLHFRDRAVIIATGYNRGFTGFEEVHYKLVEIVERKAKKILERISKKELGLTKRLRIADEIEELVNQVL